MAIDLVRPTCTPAAEAASPVVTGVVEVQVGTSGRVINAEALEPSSGPLADALVVAAGASRFKPLETAGGVPEVLSAKLTYYFEQRDGRCVARLPAEVAYVGRWSQAVANRRR
jgi:hypothetical protein